MLCNSSRACSASQIKKGRCLECAWGPGPTSRHKNITQVLKACSVLHGPWRHTLSSYMTSSTWSSRDGKFTVSVWKWISSHCCAFFNSGWRKTLSTSLCRIDEELLSVRMYCTIKPAGMLMCKHVWYTDNVFTQAVTNQLCCNNEKKT